LIPFTAVKSSYFLNKLAAATHSGTDQFDEYEHFHSIGARVLSITSLSLLKDSALDWQQKIRQIK
jgi:hypothetical protein